jgi:hypothetical protein
MTNLKQLNGIASDLADSIINSKNIDAIKLLPANQITIDLLTEKIGPDTESRDFGISVMRYHAWFNEEIKKLGIERSTISRVSITIQRKPEGKSIVYTSNVAIETSDKKKFEGKKTLSWNL